MTPAQVDDNLDYKGSKNIYFLLTEIAVSVVLQPRGSASTFRGGGGRSLSVLYVSLHVKIILIAIKALKTENN